MQKLWMVSEKCVSRDYNEFGANCNGRGTLLIFTADNINQFNETIIFFYYQIRNEKTDLCLAVDYEDMHVCLQRCSGNGKSQAFVYTRDNKILSSSIECIVADSEAGFLYASFCDLHKSSLWKFNEKVSEYYTIY